MVYQWDYTTIFLKRKNKKIKSLLTNNYSIRNIVKELERYSSNISRKINNIPRECMGYKTPKEFYENYPKCCTSSWNLHFLGEVPALLAMGCLKFVQTFII